MNGHLLPTVLLLALLLGLIGTGCNDTAERKGAASAAGTPGSVQVAAVTSVAVLSIEGMT